MEHQPWWLDHWHWTGGGLLLTCARVGWWLWTRRKSGRPIPVFGWLGDFAATKPLLILTTIQLKTERAKNARLEAVIREMEARSLADESAARSSDYPGSILVRSNPPSTAPPENTPAKPGSDPL